MIRIALITLLAASAAAPALASGTLTVTVSDRGTNSTNSPDLPGGASVFIGEGN
jgi:hypothetical protein